MKEDIHSSQYRTTRCTYAHMYRWIGTKKPLWYIIPLLILLSMIVFVSPSLLNAQPMTTLGDTSTAETNQDTRFAPLRKPLAQYGFEFVGPPTISMATYQAVYCSPRHGMVSDACPYAPQMYQMLVDAGIDPVIELAFAAKETEFGVTGPGRAPQYNIHNIICNGLDGSTCQGPYHTRFATYASYPHATQAWIDLMLYRGIYVDAGRTNFRSVIPVYAPSFENDTGLYIAQVESWALGWRSWENANAFPVQAPVWEERIKTPPTTLGDPRFLNGEMVADIHTIGITTPPAILDKPTAPADAVAVVDNNGSGFSSNQDTWIPGWCGVDDKHVVTRSTSNVQHSRSRASWVPSALQPGVYEVLVYIPSCGHGLAAQAVQYVITHDEGVSHVTINQEASIGQWVSLGAYPFGARFNPTVEITDLAQNDNRDVIADAVAWIPSEQASSTASSEEYSGVPMPQTSIALSDPRYPDKHIGFVQPTTSTDTMQDVRAIAFRGHLRTSPRGDPAMIVARLCPGDEVAIFETQQHDDYTWLRVRVLAVSASCEGTHATEGMDGWIRDMIASKPAAEAAP